METTGIIRIEHPESGIGIFNHYCWLPFELREFCRRHNDFPTPSDETNLKPHFTFAHFCAYKSLEQLSQWVLEEEIQTMIKEGFKFYSIKADNCFLGEFQAIYTKESITEKTDITSLLENETTNRKKRLHVCE